MRENIRVRRKIQSLLAALFLIVCGSASVVLADTYSSPNYYFNESQVGPGGGNISSTNYQSAVSIGDTTVGNATGSTYQSWNGFNTTTTPYLEAFVAGGNINIGTLSTITAATASSTFHVRAYLASGYVVQSVASGPVYGGHTINYLNSPAASSPGTEQFGINLVANTSPAVGANPSQQPDTTFSFGSAATGYNTPNQFKYNQGDIIAKSVKSSGETDYTISYLMNISNTTPGGTYIYTQNLVITATF